MIPAAGAGDAAAAAAARGELDPKTKPRGSLGRLEELAAQLAAIPGTSDPPVRAAIVVAGADHGVARASARTRRK